MNMHELEKRLSNENADWRKVVFEKSGVVVIPEDSTTEHYWRLVSCCGECDFDSLEFNCESHKNTAEANKINGIADLITYITESEQFRVVLQDISFGTFNKSDLFWAIQYQIMRQNCYDGKPLMQVYGMRAITNEGNTLCFETSACGLDEIPGVEIELGNQDTLDFVVEQVAKQLKEFRESQTDWTEEEYPPFSYVSTEVYRVPKTFEEVSEAMKSIQY